MQLFLFWLRFLREAVQTAGRLEGALWGEAYDDGAHIQTGWNPPGTRWAKTGAREHF